MTTLVLEQDVVLRAEDDQARHPQKLGLEGKGGARGRLTLDDLIVGVWEGLAVRATVPCPVCQGRMIARERPDGSRHGVCRDCGTRLG